MKKISGYAPAQVSFHASYLQLVATVLAQKEKAEENETVTGMQRA